MTVYDKLGIPDTWMAAVLRRPGEPLDIVEVNRPALKPGQVLVDLKYSGVCRSQLMEARGLRGDDRWLPHLLGHEGVGTVAGIGSGVAKVKVGDPVVVGWIKGDGLESDAPSFLSVDGEYLNSGLATTFSEYTVASENRVYLRRDDLDDRVAALLGCALLTGAGMVLNEARPEPGQVLLINGLGGVGLSALFAALSCDSTIVVSDPSADKRRYANGLGVRHVLDPDDGPIAGQVMAVFPEGVDLAIDASGTVAGIEAAFGCLRYGGGRLIFATHPTAGEMLRLDPHDLIKGRRIQGSWGGDCRPDRDVPRIAAAIHGWEAGLSLMVSDIYELSEVNQALDDLGDSRSMRPLLRTGLSR